MNERCMVVDGRFPPPQFVFVTTSIVTYWWHFWFGFRMNPSFSSATSKEFKSPVTLGGVGSLLEDILCIPFSGYPDSHIHSLSLILFFVSHWLTDCRTILFSYPSHTTAKSTSTRLRLRNSTEWEWSREFKRTHSGSLNTPWVMVSCCI